MTALIFACAAVLPALADTPTEDAPPNAYFAYTTGKINFRIDKIERVLHVDNGPLAKSADPGDGTQGYLIITMSVQNAGPQEHTFPAMRESVLLDDQSTVEDTLQPKQTVKVRIALFGIPADRTVTKIILDPNEGSPKRRLTIKAGDIATIPEIPRPKPAE